MTKPKPTCALRGWPMWRRHAALSTTEETVAPLGATPPREPTAPPQRLERDSVRVTTMPLRRYALIEPHLEPVDLGRRLDRGRRLRDRSYDQDARERHAHPHEDRNTRVDEA